MSAIMRFKTFKSWICDGNQQQNKKEFKSWIFKKQSNISSTSKLYSRKETLLSHRCENSIQGIRS